MVCFLDIFVRGKYTPGKGKVESVMECRDGK